MKNDKTISPLPEHFNSRDEFSQWRTTFEATIQEVLARLIKYRFLAPKAKVEVPKILLKVVQARGLQLKDKVYCSIKFQEKTFKTDPVKNNNAPSWNQHLKLEGLLETDHITVQVFDSKNFLGHVRLSVESIMKGCSRERNGVLSVWRPLVERGEKKDRYVGGEIQLEFSAAEVHFKC